MLLQETHPKHTEKHENIKPRDPPNVQYDKKLRKYCLDKKLNQSSVISTTKGEIARNNKRQKKKPKRRI